MLHVLPDGCSVVAVGETLAINPLGGPGQDSDNRQSIWSHWGQCAKVLDATRTTSSRRLDFN
jgi:hypothetical protein